MESGEEQNHCDNLEGGGESGRDEETQRVSQLESDKATNEAAGSKQPTTGE